MGLKILIFGIVISVISAIGLYNVFTDLIESQKRVDIAKREMEQSYRDLEKAWKDLDQAEASATSNKDRIATARINYVKAHINLLTLNATGNKDEIAEARENRLNVEERMSELLKAGISSGEEYDRLAAERMETYQKLIDSLY